MHGKAKKPKRKAKNNSAKFKSFIFGFGLLLYALRFSLYASFLPRQKADRGQSNNDADHLRCC